jgi:hypothetical protein
MGISQWLKNLFGGDEEASQTNSGSQSASAPKSNGCASPQPSVSLPMDEEEKNLVAVIAACIGGKDQPDAQLHIQRITRIQ